MRPLFMTSLLIGLGLVTSLPAAVTVGVGVGNHHHRHHHRNHCHTGLSWHVGIHRTYRPRYPARVTYIERPVTVVRPCPPQPCRTQTVITRPISPPDSHVVIRPVAQPAQPCGNAVVAYSQFHENGVLAVSGSTVDGVRHGSWEWFDHCGNRLQRGSYVDGLRDGLWIRYDRRGRVSYQATYRDGRRIRAHGHTCKWL